MSERENLIQCLGWALDVIKILDSKNEYIIARNKAAKILAYAERNQPGAAQPEVSVTVRVERDPATGELLGVDTAQPQPEPGQPEAGQYAGLSCNQVPKGNGYCVKCANGDYANCLYIKPPSQPKRGIHVSPEISDTARSVQDEKDLAELRQFFTREGAVALLQKYWPDLLVEQCEAEPVAYRYKDARGHWRYVGAPLTKGWNFPDNINHEPLYAHPAPRAAVPGWKMVPAEPTESMLSAANEVLRLEMSKIGLTENSKLDASKAASNYYRAMIAAAPEQGGE